MSDDSFIREVNEELRSDRVSEFWDRYGKFVFAIGVAIVLAVGIVTYLDYRDTTRAAASGDAFMAAVELAEQGKTDEAVAALEALEAEVGGAYGAMAQLRAASELAKQGKATDAIAAYDVLIADAATDENLRAIARLRAGYLLVDEGTVDDVNTRVGPLSAPGAPYRASAREALGLAYFKAGELQQAYDQFAAIADDPNSPAAMGQRLSVMFEVIASQGGPVRGAPSADGSAANQ